MKEYMTRRGIKKLMGKTVVYNCDSTRTVIVDWVEFDGKNDRPQFGGNCIKHTPNNFGSSNGYGVWGYVEDIIEVRP